MGARRLRRRRAACRAPAFPVCVGEAWAGVPSLRAAFTVSHAEPSLARVVPRCCVAFVFAGIPCCPLSCVRQERGAGATRRRGEA